jgi:cholesterol 7alpha-monooxygenase
MRRVVEEFTILGDMLLLKGQQVICVTRSVHIDPEIFEEPLEYKPERFLNATNNLSTLSENLLPFGGGVSMVI